MRFVELTHTIPVQGPESDVLGHLVTSDFLAMLNARNRQIVVLLQSGMTSKTEIADVLEYANHSAISKRLVKSVRPQRRISTKPEGHGQAALRARRKVSRATIVPSDSTVRSRACGR